MNKLIKELYGDNAIDKLKEHVTELQLNSNFFFEPKYMKVGMYFLFHYLELIKAGTEKKCPLYALVCKSFGEAAIAYFQGGLKNA